MNRAIIKLSSPSTHQYWEIPVLYEDDHLLALDKPSQLLTSPDRYDPDRPNLMKLLHKAMEDGKPWVRERGLDYLMNPHRLDYETSGILLLAKSKPVLVGLSNLFGTEKPAKTYVAVAQGSPRQGQFEVNAPLAPHPTRLGRMRVFRQGKKSRTLVKVLERYKGYCLLECRPLTGRTHQIRVHLKHAGHSLCGDHEYGGKRLLLSRLKPDFRLKPKKRENPLLDRPALHAAKLEFPHPVTGQPVVIEAPWPKDIAVAVKYLRRYAGKGALARDGEEAPRAEEAD